MKFKPLVSKNIQNMKSDHWYSVICVHNIAFTSSLKLIRFISQKPKLSQTFTALISHTTIPISSLVYCWLYFNDTLSLPYL